MTVSAWVRGALGQLSEKKTPIILMFIILTKISVCSSCFFKPFGEVFASSFCCPSSMCHVFEFKLTGKMTVAIVEQIDIVGKRILLLGFLF